jgi:hypothetical protein
MAATIITETDFFEVRGDTVLDQAFTRRGDLLKVVVPHTITKLSSVARSVLGR